MKKTLVVLAFILVVFLILLLGTMYLFKSRASPQKAATTEKLITMPVTGLAINPFQGTIDLKNVALLNPDGFSDRVFASVPELYVDLDMATITSPKKHFREIRLHLESMVIVRRKDGLYNFELLLERRAVRKKAEKKAKEKKTTLRIDRLRLQVGHFTFLDYTVRGDKPLIIRFDVALDKTYTNINDLEATGNRSRRRSSIRSRSGTYRTSK